MESGSEERVQASYLLLNGILEYMGWRKEKMPILQRPGSATRPINLVGVFELTRMTMFVRERHGCVSGAALDFVGCRLNLSP